MSPTKKHTINVHMRHKESTADSNYVLKVNTDKASMLHVLMRNIFNKGQSGGEHKAEKPNLEDHQLHLKVMTMSLLCRYWAFPVNITTMGWTTLTLSRSSMHMKRWC